MKLNLKIAIAIFIIVIAIAFAATNEVCAFSMVPAPSHIHTREQISMSYGVFEPGNNWVASSGVVNETGEETKVLGRQVKIRYEDYNWDFVDFRFGVDMQSIDDDNLTFQSTLLVIEFCDNFWRSKKHRLISVGTLAYSPYTIITAGHETLRGTSYKYELGFEYAYAMYKNWSFKAQTSYQYHKLNNFQTTDVFDPSYMVIRGLGFSARINYIF